MSLTRSLLSFLVLAVWDKPRGVTCINNFVRFSYVSFLSGYVCPKEHVIQEQTEWFLVDTNCLAFCSKQPSCRGVFFEPEDNRRCVMCSATYFVHDSSSVLYSGYMKRHETNNSTPKISAYQLIEHATDFVSSQENCVHYGGNLLTITSKEEYDYVVENVIKSVDVGVWTGGLGYGGKAEEFVWLDGSAVSAGYTNWKDGQPSPTSDGVPTCLQIEPESFTWSNEDCWTYLYSVCKFE